MVEIKVYPPQNQKQFEPDDLLTARGTETPAQRSEKPPFSRLEPRRLTGPAYYYALWTSNGDDSAWGGRMLIAHLASEIGRHARHTGWQIPLGHTYPWAAIVMEKHKGNEVSSRKAAELIGGISYNHYRRRYQPQEPEILSWLKGWREQSRG